MMSALLLGVIVLAGCAHAGAEPSKFPDRVPPAVTAEAPVSQEPAVAASTVPPTSVAPTTAPPTTKPAAPTTTRPATPVGLADGTPCKATVSACVQLSTKKAWLVSGGKVAYGPVPITSGRAGWRTPPGMFAVTFKNINHKSSLFNDAPMPYSVFFNGGIAFHQGSLSQQSHGCIHLSKAAAQAFFAALSKGEPVQVVS
ncbi:putative secreted protein [Pseudonocardia sp. N23]|nr:putative secreted protein [Pseudonocardia sp. N23]